MDKPSTTALSRYMNQEFGSIRSTFQIGEPAVIAERTGITTIAQFRARDLAAGGEGAPLAPYAHSLVFGHRSRARLVVNLGGIANVTLLPAGSQCPTYSSV